jgi:hypothetical protein
MKLLTPILVALSLAASCGPPVVIPECPPGTRPLVCRQIGIATCGDGLTPVVGCYVQVDGDTRLECVSECN